MRKLYLLFFVLVMGVSSTTSAESDGILQFGRFGSVTIYKNSPLPLHVVLFVSGDGGWNLGVVDMARVLSSNDALVIGINITHYLKELGKSHDTCVYSAADFESLSKFVQKKLGFPLYKIPVLLRYSSGATLVYATLVQAPPNTFGGAISLGFCPDLLLPKPLCKGYGLEWKLGPKGKGYRFLPATNLQSPWIAFQGTIDQVCDPASTEAYVKQVNGGEIVMLPKVGHGFSVQRNWMPQFKEAFRRLVAKNEAAFPAERDELKDLPLVVVPAAKPSTDTLAVIISGDGGWAGIDRDLGAVISANGISVVGLNSLQYFWTARTPDGGAKDLERILKHYCAFWNKKNVILIGYSLGADVLPFMANRLPHELLERVRLICLLGPGQRASFEFHLVEWLTNPSDSNAMLVYPELQKLKGVKVICFCGEKEEDSLCRKADAGFSKIFVMKGAHHFGGDYTSIANIILNQIKESQ